MSTLKTVNLQHPSSSVPNLILGAGGNVRGAGLDLIVASTFSASAAVNINNCFSSMYSNYRVDLALSAVSGANPDIGTRLRSAGSDNSTASSYKRQYIYNNTATTVSTNTTSGTQWDLGSTDTTTPAYTFWSLDICGPYLLVPTSAFGRFSWTDSSAVTKVMTCGLAHNQSSSYDGISLFPSTGTISGTIYVYGYRKA